MRCVRALPAIVGGAAVAVAAVGAVATLPTEPASARTGVDRGLVASTVTGVELPDVRTELEELRQSAAASRARVRPVPTAAPAPAVPLASPAPPAPPPGPPPIVGDFAPVEGCTAVVPDALPPNGRLETSELCSIGDNHLLRADAAATYLALDEAFRAEFGTGLAITDSYRSYDSQTRLYGQKPGLAARPGTSNHGWGIAVDVFGGVDSYGSPQHAWLAEHGPSFGWINPPWAQSDGSRPEPWHWEFDAALLD